MSKGAEHLASVNIKLKNRLKEIDESIAKGQKDIESMNDYYWENYTEMDQYGYENFDNQQALFAEVAANQEQQKARTKLKRMIDAPFFGSVEFVYDGDDEPEGFFIGINNFSETKGSVPLIYDWRAPVSGLFYDYDKGPAVYEAPAGQMDGEITSKWQYKIRRGKMVYEVETDVKIDDEILKEELSANSDTALKNIVRTIQKEQNAIIRNTSDKILVIQGAAGSGKTSIALHRIAYLLYHDRANLKSSNVMILSPNSVFSDYISHILPELGEENIAEMSFDLFAYQELKGIVSDCEDRYDHIEHMIAGMSAKQQERFAWKQSEAFVQAVEGFLIELEDRLLNFKPVSYKGMHMSESEMMRFFYEVYADVPLLSRMDTIRDYFVDAYETLSGKSISEEGMEYISDVFSRMYVTKDIYQIYNWLMEECDYPLLAKRSYENRVLSYEDVYPMLYLKSRLLSGAVKKQVRHLVIDEMQDYSYLQYVLIEKMFSCNMTILGDRAQTVGVKAQDAATFLRKIFKKKARVIEINKSYRNTVEIAAYAEKFANADLSGIEYIDRHGKAVKEILPDEFLQYLHVGEEGYETAAVLTMTEQEAWHIFTRLKDKGIQVSYIDRNSNHFEPGLSVTTFYMAKGLEFDQVFLMSSKNGSDPTDEKFTMFDRYQYIGATRALHELYVTEN